MNRLPIGTKKTDRLKSLSGVILVKSLRFMLMPESLSLKGRSFSSHRLIRETPCDVKTLILFTEATEEDYESGLQILQHKRG